MENKPFITTNPYEETTNMIHTNPALFLLKDNCYPITIALKPEYQKSNRYDVEAKITSYAIRRKIQFKIYVERPDKNTHYHGWISYPNEKTRKNFQQLINKYGKIFHSKKDDNIDTSNWVRYCIKNDYSGIPLSAYRYNNYFDYPASASSPQDIPHPYHNKTIIIIPESQDDE